MASIRLVEQNTKRVWHSRAGRTEAGALRSGCAEGIDGSEISQSPEGERGGGRSLLDGMFVWGCVYDGGEAKRGDI